VLEAVAACAMAKRMNSLDVGQLMDREPRIATNPPKQNPEALPQPRPVEAPKEALARWEDEGGHLTESGNGKN